MASHVLTDTLREKTDQLAKEQVCSYVFPGRQATSGSPCAVCDFAGSRHLLVVLSHTTSQEQCVLLLSDNFETVCTRNDLYLNARYVIRACYYYRCAGLAFHMPCQKFLQGIYSYTDGMSTLTFPTGLMFELAFFSVVPMEMPAVHSNVNHRPTLPSPRARSAQRHRSA